MQLSAFVVLVAAAFTLATPAAVRFHAHPLHMDRD
jgi:hypothetical protein